MATSEGHVVTPSGVKVRDVMRPPAGALSPDATIAEALARMQALGATALPVVDAERALLGVARTDALERVAEGARAEAVKGHIAATVTATPEMDVGRLAEMMRYKKMDWILVLEARHLVGTLTLAEAERAAAPGGPAG
jgi:CBS domain-containing protein